MSRAAEREARREAVREANPIEAVAERLGVVWDARKSVRARGDLWACCPIHQERTASFHVDVARGVWHCFGGCGGGDVFALVQAVKGCGFAEAVAWLGGADLPAPSAEDRARRAAAARRREAAAERERAARRASDLERARAIWAAAEPDAPLLRAYLAARGVRLEALGGVPPTLRLHPDLEYWGEGGLIWRGPAMVAAVGRGGPLVGVHRTWIAPDGSGRARVGGVKLDKRMLGACFGEPVRLAPLRPRMIVGEGIETTLAALSLLRARGEEWAADAALSLGALAGAGAPGAATAASRATGRPLPTAEPDWDRPGWQAPEAVDRVVILGEGSEKDPEAAEAWGLRALRRHALRPSGRPRACRLALPGGSWASGMDFADLAAGAAR